LFPAILVSWVNEVNTTMGKLASDDLEARLAKSKSPPLIAANFFAPKRELDISLLLPLPSSNALRCRLCETLTKLSVIARQEKMEMVCPTNESADNQSTNI
jgi:hypothetical protein